MTGGRDEPAGREGEAAVRRFYEGAPYPDLGAAPKDMRPWLRPILADLRRRSRVRYLEAGCGTGHGVVGAARHFPDWEYFAVDLSRPSLAIAERLAAMHGAKITFHCGSYLDPLPFGGGFDVISCAGTIHHAADPATALRNLLGHLRDDGYILVHLYGKDLDRGKFRIKELLDILEPDRDDHARRFALYRALVAKRRRGPVDWLLDASLRSVYRDLRALARNLWRRARRVSWSPPWTAAYPALTAPWVDHFCHPLERAYDVRDVEALATAAGLEVAFMLGQGREDLELLPPPWRADYDRLDQWSKWRLMELLRPAPASFSIIGRKAGVYPRPASG